jgi:RimJ/RimL family protein N-acetyltransferase
VTRWIGGPFSTGQVRERLLVEIAGEKACGVEYWPIFLKPRGLFVGCAGLKLVPAEPGCFELGFHLRPRFWGRGLATEAAQAVIAHAFKRLNAPALFAGHHPGNLRSRRVLEKLGFTYLREEFFPPTGLAHPWYRLNRPWRST